MYTFHTGNAAQSGFDRARNICNRLSLVGDLNVAEVNALREYVSAGVPAVEGLSPLKLCTLLYGTSGVERETAAVRARLREADARAQALLAQSAAAAEGLRPYAFTPQGPALGRILAFAEGAGRTLAALVALMQQLQFPAVPEWARLLDLAEQLADHAQTIMQPVLQFLEDVGVPVEVTR
jgi:hypothetical protein